MAADRYELPGSLVPQELGVMMNSRPLSPRSKRQRVSFATVTQRTFASGCEDPTSLSSPHERQLSPLLEPSIISDRSAIDQHDRAYNEEDSTAELRFPDINELCRMTPEHSRCRRNSLTGELGQMQKQIAHALGPSPSPGNHDHAQTVGGIPGFDEVNPVAEATATTATPPPFAPSQPQHGPTSPESFSEASVEGQTTGEVTANVVSLTNLVLLDECDAANAEASSVPEMARQLPNPSPSMPNLNLANCQTETELGNGMQTAFRPSGDGCLNGRVHGTPCTWPLPPMEASPDQDLFKEFKRTAQMLDTPATAGEGLSDEAEAEEENETMHSRDALQRDATEHTVEFDCIFKKVQHDGESEDSKVPEARRDFVGLQRHNDGHLSPSGIHEFSSDELLATEGIDFERLNRDFDFKLGYDTPCEGRSCGIGGVETSVNTRQTSHETANVAAVPMLSNVAAAPELSQRASLGSLDVLAHQQCDAAASAESVLQYSFVSNESTPLPAASSLLSIPNNSEFVGSWNHRRMSWDDFLSQCEIDFGSAAHARCRGDTAATAKPKRKEYVQLATTELLSMTSESKHRVEALVRSWNHAGKHPPSLVELLRATDLDKRTKFLERLRCWEDVSKVEAKLLWYQTQSRWLRADLNVQRSATAELQQKLRSGHDNMKQLEQLRTYMHSRLQQGQQKAALQHNSVWASCQRVDKDMHEHNEFVGQQVSRAQEASDLEREKLEQLESCVEQARRALVAARHRTSGLQRSYLLKRAQRVALQRQQLARTCFAHNRTPEGVDLLLRGGAKVSVEPLGNSTHGISEDLVCMRLRLPPRGAAPSLKLLSSSLDDEEELAQTLWMYKWYSVLAALPKASVIRSQKAAMLEVVLPCAEIPCLVSQLDASALRIHEQVEILSKLHQDCQGVLRVEPRLHDAGRLGLVVTLISVRSHTVDDKGITPLRRGVGRNHVDSSKLTLTLNWQLAGFPESDSIDWSSIKVHQVFGRQGDALAVERALQQIRGSGGGRGGSLRQALTVSLEALKHDVRADPLGSRS